MIPFQRLNGYGGSKLSLLPLRYSPGREYGKFTEQPAYATRSLWRTGYLPYR